MSNVVEIKDLEHVCNGKKILDKVSLTLKLGSFTTVIGNSSIGKSTIARYIAGKYIAKSYVKIDGMFANPKNIKKIREKVSIVTENPDNFFVSNIVEDDIRFLLKKKGLKDEEINQKIKSFLKTLGYDYVLNLSPTILSGGEKQLVAMFLAITANPKILIIDNGMSMIDNITRVKIFQLLKRLNKKGMTIVHFTHDYEDMLKGDSIVLMQDNNIILNEKLENAFSDMKKFTDSKVKLPFIIDLSMKLRYYKVIDKIYFDMNKLVDDLWK